MEMAELFSLLAATVAGAVLYVWRGGGIFLLPWETVDDKSTQVRRVTYAAGLGLLAWLLGAAPLVAVVAGLVAFAIQLPGNGRAVGAAGGWEEKELAEWGPLDAFATFITDALKGPPTENKRLWGLVWFTDLFALEALLFAFLPALVAWGAHAAFGWEWAASPSLAHPGILLVVLGGVAEWGLLRIYGRARGWSKAEAGVGALKGAAIALALMI